LRARVIGQIADAFERRRDSLLDLLAAENGKVKGEAGFELDMVPSKLFILWAYRADGGRRSS
jgi:betaine-aldehyde dehydrogenase